MTNKELENILSTKSEFEQLEFKTAKNNFSLLGDKGKNKKSIYGYVVALSNEGGGKLILGVTNNVDSSIGRRTVVGTLAIKDTVEAKSRIFNKTGLKINIEEVEHPNGRVLIFTIPPRPTATVLKFYGTALARIGEELIIMPDSQYRNIILEEKIDFSADFCDGLKVHDLSKEAIDKLKVFWANKSGNSSYRELTDVSILKKLLLLRGNSLTNTALLLLAKPEVIAVKLPQAEFIFEWRSKSGKTDFDQRKVWREPFLLSFRNMEDFVLARNSRIPIKNSFIESDIWSYDKNSIREALLNAFAHREYRSRYEPSIVKIDPENFIVKSPGGFLHGVSAENAIHSEGKWRNRFLMEVLERIGLVERAGIGLDRIFSATISAGKGLPNLNQNSSNSIILTIPAIVKDIQFVYYLQKISKEKNIELKLDQIIELEKIRNLKKVKDIKYKEYFTNLGIVEVVGRGRGSMYYLSHNYYQYEGQTGEYTRLTGLSREAKKQLIIKHLEKNKNGAKFSDIKNAFPDLSQQDVSNLLQELKREEKIFHEGSTQSGKWKLK